jgi:DNA primase
MSVERFKVEEFLFTRLNKVKRKGSSGYRARCPFCGDSKRNPNIRRFHIDYFGKYDEWIYKCYNGGCGESGNIQSLVAYMKGIDWKEANDDLKDRSYDPQKWKARLDPKKNWMEEEDPLRTSLDIDLNHEAYFLKDKPETSEGKRYVDMLKKFHVDRKIPLRYNIAIAYAGKYSNRYIIPVFENKEMIYFQGRDISGASGNKYLNPDIVKERVILNLNEMDAQKPIVVAEGLLCGMSIEGNNGTSCLGSCPSDTFLDKIFHTHRKADIIIALDNPLIDDSGFECYAKFMRESIHAPRVRYFFMPNETHKDLNDVRIAEGWGFNLLDFIDKNSHSHFISSIKINQKHKYI